MSGLLDFRLLWILGAAFIVFAGLGLLSIGSVVGALFWLTAAVFQIAYKDWFLVFLYSGVLWAPIGVGMGFAVTIKITRGIMTKPKQTESELLSS